VAGLEERRAARGLGLHRVDTDATNASSAPNARTPAVLRLFDAPESIEVEEAAGVPDACWWRGRRLSFSAIDGPERLSGDWWRVDAFARDYWRCMVASEGELLLYRDAGAGLTPRWFVQGWYD
jgi:protein ImuB